MVGSTALKSYRRDSCDNHKALVDIFVGNSGWELSLAHATEVSCRQEQVKFSRVGVNQELVSALIVRVQCD